MSIGQNFCQRVYVAGARSRSPPVNPHLLPDREATSWRGFCQLYYKGVAKEEPLSYLSLVQGGPLLIDNIWFLREGLVPISQYHERYRKRELVVP